MTDTAAVKASVGNMALAIKGAIERGDAEIVTDIDQMVDDLTAQVNQEIADFGQDEGEQFTAVYERYIDLAGGNTINCWSANHFGKVITANTTFTLQNVPAPGKVYTFTMRLTNAGAHNVSFWGDSNIYWSEGVKPEFAVEGRDNVAFSTNDGGATWDGYLLGKSMRLPA